MQQLLPFGKVFQDFDLNSLTIPSYQRQEDKKRVERIANKFDPARYEPITVTKINGKFEITKGQHRLAAMRKLGYRHAPAYVLGNDIVDNIATAAMIFAKDDENRKRISEVSKFDAALIAKDPWAEAVKVIFDKYGLVAGFPGKYPNVASIAAIRRITNKWKMEHLDYTLNFISHTWRGDLSSTRGDFIEGCALFLTRYKDQIEQKHIDDLKSWLVADLVRNSKSEGASTRAAGTAAQLRRRAGFNKKARDKF